MLLSTFKNCVPLNVICRHLITTTIRKNSVSLCDTSGTTTVLHALFYPLLISNLPMYVVLLSPFHEWKTQIKSDEELPQGHSKWQSWSSNTRNLWLQCHQNSICLTVSMTKVQSTKFNMKTLKRQVKPHTLSIFLHVSIQKEFIKWTLTYNSFF